MKKLIALGTGPSKWFEVTGVAEEKVRLGKTPHLWSNADTVFLPEAIACAPVFSGKYLMVQTYASFQVAQSA